MDPEKSKRIKKNINNEITNEVIEPKPKPKRSKKTSDTIETKPKPKRVLSEQQKLNLLKGQEALKVKREAKKKNIITSTPQ